jgi:hypothetical protein
MAHSEGMARSGVLCMIVPEPQVHDPLFKPEKLLDGVCALNRGKLRTHSSMELPSCAWRLTFSVSAVDAWGTTAGIVKLLLPPRQRGNSHDIRALARGVGMLTTPCAASGRLSVPRPVTAAAVVKNSRRLDDMGFSKYVCTHYSVTDANTIGIVAVAALAAIEAGVLAGVAITATRRRTRSAISAGRRSYWPSSQLYSTVTLSKQVLPWRLQKLAAVYDAQMTSCKH